MSQPNPPQGTTPRGRPGAMTMAMQAVQVKQGGPKVLRVGLIQSGKIIEERIIRRRETVSVGSSERNHFIVHTAGMPPRFELFQLVGSDYILNFTADMRGRVGLPGGVQDLEQLRKTGAARNAGSHWQVKLNDNSRGKVVIGDITLLFQFVTPPPVQPRPQLPAAARGGFVKSIDWLFTAFIVFTYMTVFGFMIYLENADWPIESGITSIRPSMARFILEAPPPPPETEQVDETDESDQGEETDEVVQETAPKPSNDGQKDPSPGPEETAQAQAEATARIVEEASDQVEMMLMGALDSSGGELADLFAGGAVVGNAEDVMAQASGVAVADSSQAGNLRTRSGGGSGRRTGDLGKLRSAGGTGATKKAGEGGPVAERRIRGSVKFSGGDETGGRGEFDQSEVAKMIRARKSAFRRCYETALRNNPSLAGKVVVEFTIVERGTVTGARSTANTTNDPGVASCVVGVVRRLRWRQGPEGGSVTYSYPFVFAPQR